MNQQELLQEIARLHDRIKDLEMDVEFLSQPAPKPWVGLTIREIEWCFEDANGASIASARNIEAKLREKNS